MCLAISNYALKLPRWCKCGIYPIVVFWNAFFIQQRILIYIVAIIVFYQILQTYVIKLSPSSIMQTHLSWFDQNSLKRYYQYEHRGIQLLHILSLVSRKYKILIILSRWLYNLLCIFFCKNKPHLNVLSKLWRCSLRTKQ